MELAESLNLLQRQSSLFEIQESEHVEDGIANDLNALTYQDSVLEVPLVTTKAALYIYLNAMVCFKSVGTEAVVIEASFVEDQLQMIRLCSHS